MMSAADNNNQPPTQQQQQQLPNVIVVGAGLAGLATSLGLANTGRFQVDLVELRPDFSRQGATFGLAPNGVKALEEIDPGDEGVMHTLDQLGTNLKFGDRHAYMLGWWMVRNTLLERVRSKSNLVRLHMGYTLKDIVDDPGAPLVRATFVPSAENKNEEDDHNDSQRGVHQLTLDGCLIVGADGVHSSVRSFLKCSPAEKVGTTIWRGGIVVDPNDPGKFDPAHHDVLVALLEKGAMPIGGFRVFGPTIVGVFNFHGKVPGRMNWTISTVATDIPSKCHPWEVALEPFVSDEQDRNVLKAVLNHSNQDDVWYPSKFSVVKPPEEDGSGWGGKGRVVLIGDAAHAMRATTGQGGNISFEDAVVLCRALREVDDPSSFADFDAMSALVLHVENTRLVRVRKVWAVEQLMAEIKFNIRPEEDTTRGLLIMPNGYIRVCRHLHQKFTYRRILLPSPIR